MAFLAFSGDRVGAVNSANDDGSGGVDLELDTDRDLDGSGNPYYSPTSTIVIEIDDADIGPNGEFQEAGDDGVVTVLSIKVDGVEILSDTDKVKFGGGGDTFEGDGFFFVECVKLFFLSPIYTDTFADAVVNSGKLELNVPDRVSDNDFNENSTIDSGTTEVGNGIFNIQTSNVVCYASGTMIPTPDGEVPVETLEASDSVATIDQGFLPIRWIGSRTLSEAELEQTPNLRPIRIRSGALGQGTPAVDLVVSPQHRILIRSKIAERMFDSAEVLIAAKHLLGMDGIEIATDILGVTYWHFMFDRNEIVSANGAFAEALYPGPEALKSVSDGAREELLALFPNADWNTSSEMPEPARPFVRAKRARQLLERSQKNKKPLVATKEQSVPA